MLINHRPSSRRHDLFIFILLVCIFAIIFGIGVAKADTNLALTCGPGASVPSQCAAGWTWRVPVKGSIVITQGGSWRLFSVPPNTTDLLTICGSDVLPGSPRVACSKIVYGAGCNTKGQSCGDPAQPPVVDDTLIVTWVNQSDNVVSNTLYRGTKADGSDLMAYKSLPIFLMFADHNLTPGQWCYSVTASNDGGESDKSPVACGMIAQPAVAKPAVPSKPLIQKAPP